MSTVLYTEQENGNLKLVAEVEGIDNPALAVDALLDDAPRLKEREFVVVNFEDGTLVRVTVDDDEPVNPRRSMTVTGANSVVAEEEPTPAPQRRQRRASSAKKRTGARKSAAKRTPAKKSSAKKRTGRKQNAPRAGSARKSAAKKPAVRSSAKKSSGRKASPFKTRPDDE